MQLLLTYMNSNLYCDIKIEMIVCNFSSFCLKFAEISSSFIVGFCIHYFWLHFILYHINLKHKQKFNYIGNDSMNFIVWTKILWNKEKRCLRVTKRRIHSPKTRRNTLIQWNICISNHFLGCLFTQKHDSLNNNYKMTF